MTYGGSRRPDLATRLGGGERGLQRRLEPPRIVMGLLRAAHEPLDPETSGGLTLDRADEWFNTPSCGVFAPDLDGQVVALSSRGFSATLEPAARVVATWVLRYGREFATANLRKDARVTGTAGAVWAWPLQCR